MNRKRLPGLILATLGIFLCLVGLLNSPTKFSLSPVWAFFVSVWESGILWQPGCIGIYGVMIFALAFNTILPREKRRRVREKIDQTIQTVKEEVKNMPLWNKGGRPAGRYKDGKSANDIDVLRFLQEAQKIHDTQGYTAFKKYCEEHGENPSTIRSRIKKTLM